jgi:hypothetical protein
LHRDFFAREILFRGLREPKIPLEVKRQVAGFVATVNRGPYLIDKYQASIFSLIRQKPALRARARSLLRIGRWVRRHARSRAK